MKDLVSMKFPKTKFHPKRKCSNRFESQCTARICDSARLCRVRRSLDTTTAGSCNGNANRAVAVRTVGNKPLAKVRISDLALWRHAEILQS